MTPIRPATAGDVEYIIENMRTEDVAECEAGGLTHRDALTLSFNGSITSYVLLTPDTGKPMAIGGIGDSSNPSWGTIWLLGTDAIKQHPYTLLLNSKPMLTRLYEETGKEAFYNYTYVENHVHHRWLRWLGFTILRKVPLIPNGPLFYEFVKIKG